jgi:hypothetical protein
MLITAKPMAGKTGSLPLLILVAETGAKKLVTVRLVVALVISGLMMRRHALERSSSTP